MNSCLLSIKRDMKQSTLLDDLRAKHQIKCIEISMCIKFTTPSF